MADPTSTDPLTWVKVAARAAAAKTDEPTVVIDVGAVLAVTGWFVITGAANTRLVRALVAEVELKVAEAGGPKPRRIEGGDTNRWVLLDYGDFVVHVLLDTEREFYDLERLWSDMPVVDWQTED